MTTKQEILDAITAESGDVKVHVDALEEKTTALEKKVEELIAAGAGQVTEADLAEILAGVQGIFTKKNPDA